jgi:hypothetical protein
MKVMVRMVKDGIEIRIVATYRRDVYQDYMFQAAEMAEPFFALGYHVVHASLLWDE